MTRRLAALLLLAALAVILARPRWRWYDREMARRERAASETEPRPADACRHCPSIAHTTEWHEAHYSYSTGSPYSVTSRADNGTGFDARLMGA